MKWSIIVESIRKMTEYLMSSFVESNMKITISLHVTSLDYYGNNSFEWLANGTRKLIFEISLKNIFSKKCYKYFLEMNIYQI